jgi:hypothetical protein
MVEYFATASWRRLFSSWVQRPLLTWLSSLIHRFLQSSHSTRQNTYPNEGTKEKGGQRCRTFITSPRQLLCDHSPVSRRSQCWCYRPVMAIRHVNRVLLSQKGSNQLKGAAVSLQVIVPCLTTSLRSMRSSSSAHKFRAFSVFSPCIVPHGHQKR